MSQLTPIPLHFITGRFTLLLLRYAIGICLRWVPLHVLNHASELVLVYLFSYLSVPTSRLLNCFLFPPSPVQGGKEPSSSPHPATTTHAHGSSTFPIEKKWHFNVMSYNILADEYAKEHQRELYSTVPWSALDWNRRKSLIVKEVDQWKPDVVCLQEVDHYNELADALAKKG